MLRRFFGNLIFAIIGIKQAVTLSDYITKMTFPALAFRHLFPIILRRWRFER